MMIRFDRAPTEGVKFLLEKHYRTEVSLEMLAEIDGRHFTPAEVKQFCRQSSDAETAIHYMHMSLVKTDEMSGKFILLHETNSFCFSQVISISYINPDMRLYPG